MTLLFSPEEIELFRRVANLMKELAETIEVSQDKTIAKQLKAALQEVEEGKTRPIKELVKELNLEKDAHC